MLSTKNSSWAASWLVGSAIVVSATSLAALDANVTYNRDQNGIDAQNGIDNQNHVNGIDSMNGLNINDEWSGDGWWSLPHYNEREVPRMRSSSRDEELSESTPGPEPDAAIDGYDTDTQPFGGETPADFGQTLPAPDFSSPGPPAPYPDEWNVPLNAPFNAPSMNAEWNVPPHNAPLDAGPNVHPTYPDTWRYPPLTVTEPIGLQKVGEEGPSNDAPAQEPLPLPHATLPLVPVEPQSMQQTVLEKVGETISDTVGGVISGIGNFFKSLWSF